jgi:hypothetical protein
MYKTSKQCHRAALNGSKIKHTQWPAIDEPQGL